MNAEQVAKIAKEVWDSNLKECQEKEIVSKEVILAGFLAELRERVPEFRAMKEEVFAQKFLTSMTKRSL